MATNKPKSRSRKKSGKKKSQGALSWIFGQISAARNDEETREQWRRALGWILLFVSILSFVACVSYYFSGNADQSLVESGRQPATAVKNLLGRLGAIIANTLIYKGFGIFGLAIPLYGAFVGFVLLEDNFYAQARRVLGYVTLMVLWGSTFLSFVLDLMNSGIPRANSFHYGGGVGYAIVKTLQPNLGVVGIALLLVFVIVIFLVLKYRAEVRATELISKLKDVRAGNVSLGLPGKLGGNGKSTRKKPANQPKKSTGNSPVKEAGMTNGLKPEESTEPGQQISLEVGPTPLKKAPSKSSNDLTEPEFTILDSTQEEKANVPPANSQPPSVKEFERLGDDNIGMVKGEEGKTEKIVPLADQENAQIEEVINWEEYDPTKELSDFNPPNLELLDDHGYGRNREVSREEVVSNKNKIVDTLANYGIEISNIKATIGPTVTLYEIVPVPGVRISKIRNLEDDIALSLAALGIRIIAPIPGKGTIGIEVPNSTAEIVSLRGVLQTAKFQTTKAALPIAIGRTISNEVFIADLAKMPHLLIAGATGQGKSVGLNTVITSLLYKKHPSEVKFVLIDPKKVEMSLYHNISHHFLATLPDLEEPIVTDVRDAVRVLKSLCIEMDERYDRLKQARVRNLKEYNQKFIERRLNPKKGHRYMPYIILVIDELADMMMIAGKEVEMPIARLAQLARAVGIHLVVATQRPSVNIITGIIKANFPARMSYRVISKVDSRTILDANGADQLIGRGDLLLSTGSDLIRIQNAFIDTPEVERVTEFISNQRGYPQPYHLPETPVEGDDFDDGDDDDFERDKNFEEAARLIVRYQIGSASLIQRKMKLGYNRAGRIIDQLERANIVGPHSGSKARDVLIADETELERILENYR